MNFAQLYDLACSLPGVTEDFPFGPETLVMRVGNKMFALVDISSQPTTVNLKCDPECALDLRERYEAVQPGFHQNKKHWNTVTLQSDLPDTVLTDMVRHSYDVVVAGLPKVQREAIARLASD